MSTRATYEIGDRVFYLHHDGYPAGAAAYFAKMIEALNAPAEPGEPSAIAARRGGAQFAFIRGNMNAEPTEGHIAHGDTQYRWRLTEDPKGRGFTIQAQTRIGDAGYRWSPWSAPRPLAEFINAHYPGLIVAIETPDPYWRRELLATLENAIAIAKVHRDHAARYSDDNPNKPRALEHAAAWERKILELIPARVRWLEKEQADVAAELAKESRFGREFYERRARKLGRELEALRVPIGEREAA